MTKEKMRTVIDGYIGAYNAMDVDGMLSFLHEDITFHTVTNGNYGLSVNGLDEFGELAIRSLAIFKTRKQTITQTLFEGATANAKIDYEGTLAIDMNAFGKAGETITFRGRSEFAFKDGLIHVLTDYS